MTERIIKVCVLIPETRHSELLILAASWRNKGQHKTPGWDSRAIREIANRCYGSYEKMFEAHGWPERSTRMMPNVQARVCETYGSVDSFVEKHRE
jgi:hypothetical protein